MFEFIHCADIHLGCNPSHNETRFNDFFFAFENVISYAINKNIKLILISGDFFQLRSINPKTLEKTILILKRAKKYQIDIVAIEGNHDQAYFVDGDSWLLFLQSENYLKLLQTEISDGNMVLRTYDGKKGNVIENDKYRIIGINYLGGSTEKHLENISNIIEKKDKYTILMLHAAINRLAGHNMGDVKGEVILKLKDKIDYIALGHIHYRYEMLGFAYNPGSLENVRIYDAINNKEKGFYHVKVSDDNSAKVSFINSNVRNTVFFNCDVSAAITPDDCIKIVKEKAPLLTKDDIFSLTLCGKVDFNPYLIDIEKIKSYYENKVLLVEVNNYVNILKEKKNVYEDDLQEVLYNLVIDEIKTNYPQIINPKQKAQKIISITNMLTNNINDDEIIDILVREETNDN